MANKVDAKVFARIVYLKGQQLTNVVIGQRLGLSPKTVRIYLKAHRQGKGPNVQSDSDI